MRALTLHHSPRAVSQDIPANPEVPRTHGAVASQAVRCKSPAVSANGEPWIEGSRPKRRAQRRAAAEAHEAAQAEAPLTDYQGSSKMASATGDKQGGSGSRGAAADVAPFQLPPVAPQRGMWRRAIVRAAVVTATITVAAIAVTVVGQGVAAKRRRLRA